MKKIICFIESLTGGGAEHQLVILAELLYKKGYDVTVVTMADIPDHYKLNENIQRIKLGVGKSYIGKWIAVLWYFLRVKADCIISYRQKCNIRVLPALHLPLKNDIIKVHQKGGNYDNRTDISTNRKYNAVNVI